MKKWLVFFGWVVLTSVAFALMYALIIENSTKVAFSFVGVALPEMSLATLVIATFFVGMFFGVLGGIVVAIGVRLTNMRLSTEIKKKDKEMNKMRMVALKELTS